MGHGGNWDPVADHVASEVTGLGLFLVGLDLVAILPQAARERNDGLWEIHEPDENLGRSSNSVRIW